jgi:hypothetical protein
VTCSVTGRPAKFRALVTQLAPGSLLLVRSYRCGSPDSLFSGAYANSEGSPIRAGCGRRGGDDVARLPGPGSRINLRAPSHPRFGLQIPVRSRTAAAAAIDRMDSMPLIASAIEANPSRLARILPSLDLRQNPCCPELSCYSSNVAVTFFFLRMGPVGYKGGYAAGYSALCEQAPQPKRITQRSPP